MNKIELLTRPYTLLLALAVSTLLVPFDAHAVASFTRQTGMTCNQCHTLHGGPVPNFTITGKKFRAFGYRVPSIGERIQAGEPGDQGERLNILRFQDYLSFRFQSEIYSKRKAPGQANWGEASTNPTSRLAMFYTGPVGDNIGLWMEWYTIPEGSANKEWGLSLASFEEYDLRYVLNPGDPSTVYGLALTNQGPNEITGFGPFPTVLGGNYNNRAGINGYTHPNFAHVLFYGWVNDRYTFNFGVNTGDTNTGWDKFNYIGSFAYAFQNTNANELWLNTVFRVGDDVLPLTSRSLVATNARDFSFADRIAGVAATRASGERYDAEDVDSSTSAIIEARWSKQDAGPHSFEAVVRYSTDEDDYLDGGSAEVSGIGTTVRYGYKHTWYVAPYWLTEDWKFRDRSGVSHTIDSNPSYGVWFGYKPYENFLVNYNIGWSESLRLDQPAIKGGRNHTISLDFMF